MTPSVAPPEKVSMTRLEGTIPGNMLQSSRLEVLELSGQAGQSRGLRGNLLARTYWHAQEVAGRFLPFFAVCFCVSTVR